MPELTIVETDGRKFLLLPNGTFAEIDHFAANGTPVLKARVEVKEEGTDEYGNKKISTNVSVDCIKLDLTQKDI